MQPRIEYLGHIIDKDVNTHPSCVPFSRPHLSATLTPLYILLQKQTKWSWQQEHEEAFQQVKNALQRESLLAHYDSAKPLVLAC